MTTKRVCSAIVRFARLEPTAFATLVFVALTPQMASADVSFKCKNEFVRVGDSKYVVLARCGDPEYREVVSGDAETKVEEWVYDSRSGRKRILRFRGGRLAHIERMSR